jgi:hypothetical protein
VDERLQRDVPSAIELVDGEKLANIGLQPTAVGAILSRRD